MKIVSSDVHYDLRDKLCKMIVNKVRIGGCKSQPTVTMPKCDFAKGLCLFVANDCGAKCCTDIASYDNGVTKTSYFDRGEKTLLDRVPRVAQNELRNCLRVDEQKTIAWFL